MTANKISRLRKRVNTLEYYWERYTFWCGVYSEYRDFRIIQNKSINNNPYFYHIDKTNSSKFFKIIRKRLNWYYNKAKNVILLNN